MKKRDLWEYHPHTEKKKAPERRLGSRLVPALLTGGCCVAALTAIISLSLYFFPKQSADTLHTIQGLVGSLWPGGPLAGNPANPDGTDNSDNPELSHESEASEETPAESDHRSDDSPHVKPADSASWPTDSDGEDIPLLLPSHEQGDASRIGETHDLEEEGETSYMAMLGTAMGPMLYYHQGDSRWGDYLYGGSDPIKYYGCGPTVMAMLVNAFTDEQVTPVEMADWCSENRCHASKSGSYHSIVTKTLTAFGLQVESAAGADRDTAAELLSSGHVLVALMGKGQFTNGGHFILITQLLENGNVHIADCNSYENTNMEWDLEQVLSELNRARDSGSPLWAVSFPDAASYEHQ